MDFDLQVAHSVTEIGLEAWDCLGDGHPFASYRWYRFSETVLTDDRPVYIVLSRGNEPLARATFWLKRQEPLPIPSRAVHGLWNTMLRRWPLLVCRVPLANISGLILPDPPLRDTALKTITQIAQDQAQQCQASFLLFDYLEGHETQWAGWSDAFTPATVTDPGTRLVITWPDFESYLKHLRKSVRKDYRRHRNRAADLSIEVAHYPTVTSVDEAMVLIRNVEKHHNSPPNPWARAVLENAHVVDATWLTVEAEGQLVGCGLTLGDGGIRFLALLGLDYDVRYAYFQLVYAAIRCAIEEGTRILRGGGGAYEMKQRLGFQMESNDHVTFAASNRGLRWVARRLAKNL